MESSEILTLVTIIVLFILGIIAKKVSWFNNYLIPIQNIIVGLVFAVIEFFISKDFNLAISASGLLAGGAYDVFNNIKKMIDEYKVKNDIKE